MPSTNVTANNQHSDKRKYKPCEKCAKRKQKCRHSQDAVQKSSGRPVRIATKATTLQELAQDTDIDFVLNDQSDTVSAGLDEQSEEGLLASGYPPLTMHKPQSPEALAALLFVEAMTCEGVADTWFNHVPARIGSDSCFDLSATALEMACWYKRGFPGATMQKSCRTMATALEALRLAISTEEGRLSDHTLACVAALSPADAIREGHSILLPCHLDGMTTLLLSRKHHAAMSEIARRIMEYHTCDTYVTACVRGVQSPLEDLEQLYLASHGAATQESATTKLRATGDRLCIRLPRFIKIVRAACEPSTSPAMVCSAMTIAEELSEMTDEIAETDFLHLVRVVKTTHPEDTLVTRWSFEFNSVASYEAGAYYWHTRIAVLRLCWRLRICFPTVCDAYSLPSVSRSETELRRIGCNLFMSAEYTRRLRARKRKRLFAHTMLTCWGALKDCPKILPTTMGDSSVVRAWLLSNTNRALTGQTTLTEHDMDDAVDLFTGGPFKGTYVNLIMSGGNPTNVHS